MPDLEPSPLAATGAEADSPEKTGRRPGAVRRHADYLVFAVVAFAPMLWSRPGVVSDDTKTYLYLDPGRYIRQAVSLWDPNVALGTVTHENIGYLLPMGPFYWILAELHCPLWVAQRLWMGAILFAAGAGMLTLCRTLGLRGPGRYVAALGFMFTPYVLQYAGRISVILLPWAGLPWLIAFAVLALRRGGWRYPAWFALVVLLVSGVNASSILYVGLAPVLWLPYAVLVGREATWRRAWGAAWRIGLLTALVSLWWAVGLQIEAANGINVLKYTETLPTTSSTSLASEVIRGLGYWYFYGSDRVGVWTQASVAYSQNLWLLGLTFVVPALAFLAAAFIRWRQRAYFALLALVGTVLAVGPHPYSHPSGVGSLLKAFMVDTTAGLAMRSTDRASPLVLISLSMLLGAGISALASRVRRTGWVIGGVAAAAVIGASAPLWTGAVIANGFTQPATPPRYVRQAARALDATHRGTRVYALPGNDFAAYRWGDTIDTVYPALLTRPFVTHEQQIMGSLATADLLNAIDAPLQDGVSSWDALGPMASLMSAGDVLVQYDQAYERYDTPSPQSIAAGLAPAPTGLSRPVSYGAPRPNVSSIARLDEASLTQPPNAGWTAPLVSYTVSHPRPVVRAESLANPLVLDGDAPGVVAAASLGLLAGNPTILYAGTLDTHPVLRRRTLDHPANLVVTDTNRKQGFRWNSLNQNIGYTETAAQGSSTSDPTNAPIDLFPGAPAAAQTTTVFDGISSVTASSYGSSITYLPEVRPAAAIDGNTQTAWLDNAFANPIGQWWQVTLAHPKAPGSITLVQPLTGDPDRWIASVSLRLGNGPPLRVALGAGSRTPAGQTIPLGNRSFSKLLITVTGVRTAPHIANALFESSVGFAEVHIPGVHANETVSMPQDLLRAAGSRSLADRLTLVMTRLRSSGFPPSSATEPFLARRFWLPTARTFALTGTARISTLIPDDQIDRLVGRPGVTDGGVVAYSLGRLPGDLRAGAVATLDGSSSTVWEPGFGASHQAGQWLQYQLPTTIRFDHLGLQIVADGRHSVPTSVTVTAGTGSRTLELPAIADGRVAGSVVDVPLSFAALTGRSVRITVDSVRLENTLNYHSQSPIALPIGIAEVGIPGVHAAPVPANLPGGCQDNLLAVDGSPVWTSITGTTATALDRKGLPVSLCGPDAGGLHLGPGTHTLDAANGAVTGFNLDQLALDSAPGGTAAAVSPGAPLAPAVARGPVPTVSVSHRTATTMTVVVTGVHRGSQPFDLVLGQSINNGWQATVANGPGLGAPVLVDAFANGWRVDPASMGAALRDGTLTVRLVWTPQTSVDIALLVSLTTVLLCLAGVVIPGGFRRRRRRKHRPSDARVAGDGYDVVIDPVSLAIPFGPPQERAPVPVALLTAFLVGGISAAVAPPVIGAVVAVVTLVALLVPRSRVVVGLLAAACVVTAGVSVVARQHGAHFPADGRWPTRFAQASQVVWAAVVLLAADGVIGAVLARAPSRPEDGRGRRSARRHAQRRRQ